MKRKRQSDNNNLKMTILMITTMMIIMMITSKCFPAHVQFGACRASFDSRATSLVQAYIEQQEEEEEEEEEEEGFIGQSSSRNATCQGAWSMCKTHCLGHHAGSCSGTDEC